MRTCVTADVLYLEEEVDWVKFNVDMSGYYMVHYQEEGWSSLIRLLQSNYTALSTNDRANLINNIFQLVRSALPFIGTSIPSSIKKTNKLLKSRVSRKRGASMRLT